MRLTLSLLALTLLVAPYANASPICGTIDQDPEPGYKTWNVFRTWFDPVCRYVTEEFPKKTPQQLIGHAKDTVQDMNEWVQNNDIIQSLSESLKPVKDWVTDTKYTLKDKTFATMYEDVKKSVQQMDDVIGDWANQAPKIVE